MTITLPKQPDGHQYEEAMAAAVRAIGYFTETRTIFDHDGREVLELDVVASPATEEFASKILLDAKKSSAGFSDIFKIYGWRVFLKIPKGCIVHGVAAEAPAQAAFKEVCPKLDVYAEHFDFRTEFNLATIPVLNGEAEEKLRYIARLIGWYQLIAERLCVRDFQDLKKKHPGEDIFTRVQKYRCACNLAFFQSDPFKRVELLYKAYMDDPGISGAAVEWQAHQSGKEPDKVWEAVRGTHEYPWIQHVLSLETKARILIIKNGLEAALNDAANDGKMDSFWKGFQIALLPANFQTGFQRLSKSPHRHAIPYILQMYVELFGGFLIDDVDRAHLAALAVKPVEAVAETLELLDVFYPINNQWHYFSGEVRMMKMIPGYLRGIGAFFRQSVRPLKSYSDIAPKRSWLLGNWHNAAFNILGRELAVKEEAKEASK